MMNAVVAKIVALNDTTPIRTGELVQQKMDYSLCSGHHRRHRTFTWCRVFISRPWIIAAYINYTLMSSTVSVQAENVLILAAELSSTT